MSKFTKTKEWLILEYVIKNRKRITIAKECNLTLGGLKSILIKYNIQKEKIIVTKERLKELVFLKLSALLIGQRLGYSASNIYKLCVKYKLKLLFESTYLRYDDSKDYLIVLLYTDGFSSSDIGRTLKMSHRSILNHLEYLGIKRRSLSMSQWTLKDKKFPIELQSRESLYELYITQRLSKQDLGIRFNCDACVIDRLLSIYNITKRTNSEAKKGLFTGEKHPNWQGGITSLAARLREYFYKKQVAEILKRDGYKCSLCGSKHKLEVHHIKSFSSILHRILQEHLNLNPIKDVNELYDIATKDSEFNNLDNLITYCKECHLFTIHGYIKTRNVVCGE